MYQLQSIDGKNMLRCIRALVEAADIDSLINN